ncbi:MAG: ABC transporter permease, partial [Chthoniobacterales bacterium]
AMPLLLAISPPAIRGFKAIGVNQQVLAFSFQLSVVTGILFGLIPAVAASSARPGEALRQGERGSSGRGRRGRSLLVATEVGLSLVLLIGAGLTIRSFKNLMQVDPGFTSERLLIFNVGLPSSANEERQIQFYQQVVERLQTLPGVERAGAVSRLPLSGGNSNRTFNLTGSDTEHSADVRVATPEYFRTMGVPLLRGRNFTERDTKSSVSVAIINDALARTVFAGQDPIGQYIVNIGPKNEKLEIVGVVGDVRHLALQTAPRPEIYQPVGQATWPSMFVAVRSVSTNPLALTAAVQNVVASVNEEMPLGNVRTMEDIIAATMMQRKFTMLLLTIFAGVALLLAVIGLYGVISYSVSQRTRELGIRVALGAQRSHVLKLVVGQGMAVVGIGLLLGVVASVALTRLMSALLFGVSATDTATFVGFSVVLGGVALVPAGCQPAGRAKSIR